MRYIPRRLHLVADSLSRKLIINTNSISSEEDIKEFIKWDLDAAKLLSIGVNVGK